MTLSQAGPKPQHLFVAEALDGQMNREAAKLFHGTGDCSAMFSRVTAIVERHLHGHRLLRIHVAHGRARRHANRGHTPGARRGVLACSDQGGTLNMSNTTTNGIRSAGESSRGRVRLMMIWTAPTTTMSGTTAAGRSNKGRAEAAERERVTEAPRMAASMMLDHGPS